jgi:enamine deaminase RidA (YjgF/YER057c/UK114 family)
MIFQSDDSLATFGDYSPIAIGAPGEIVAVAGQVGTDRTGAFPVSDAAEDQVRQAFHNVGLALAAAGIGFGDVLTFTTYVVGRDVIPAFMSARKEVFAEIYPDGQYPPNTLLIVQGLVEERFVVEISALAVRPAGERSS